MFSLEQWTGGCVAILDQLVQGTKAYDSRGWSEALTLTTLVKVRERREESDCQPSTSAAEGGERKTRKRHMAKQRKMALLSVDF